MGFALRVFTVIAALLCVGSRTHLDAAITVPPGFVVDTLVAGQLDNVTPRIEAITDSNFGQGVFAASVSNGILTVRQISLNSINVLATSSGFDMSASVIDLRFSDQNVFGSSLNNKLFVSVLTRPAASIDDIFTTFIVVSQSGSVVTLGPIGGSGDGLGFYLEFTDGSGGYSPGAYLFDLIGDTENPLGGSSLWLLDNTGVFSRLVSNSVPDGRVDTDVRGVEYDATGAFGNKLLVAEADDNNSQLGGVYSLNSDETWSPFSVNDDTTVRYLRDIAMSPGGALGAYAFMPEARNDVIERLDPNATVTIFASGFDFSAQLDSDPGGAASISIDESGDVMYVADDSGIYRIRPVGNEPGPTVICREPSTPSGIHTDEAGLPTLSLVWSESVVFTDTDIEVLDSDNNPVVFSVSGSGSRFMIISFSDPIFADEYTVTVHDAVISLASNAAIDGDNDGIAGGDAVIVLEHRKREDLDNDNDQDLGDFSFFSLDWLWQALN